MRMLTLYREDCYVPHFAPTCHEGTCRPLTNRPCPSKPETLRPVRPILRPPCSGCNRGGCQPLSFPLHEWQGGVDADLSQFINSSCNGRILFRGHSSCICIRYYGHTPHVYGLYYSQPDRPHILYLYTSTVVWKHRQRTLNSAA